MFPDHWRKLCKAGTVGICYCLGSAEINDSGSLQFFAGVTMKCSEIGNNNILPDCCWQC
jgi:hypothetical protein